MSSEVYKAVFKDTTAADVYDWMRKGNPEYRDDQPRGEGGRWISAEAQDERDRLGTWIEGGPEYPDRAGIKATAERDKLTDSDLRTVFEYTDMGTVVNGYLRDRDAKGLAAYASEIESMDKFTGAYETTKPITVYRGLAPRGFGTDERPFPFDLTTLQQGDVVSDPSFVSTALGLSDASMFDEHGNVMQIRLLAGVRVGATFKLDNRFGEVTLPRGAQFKYTGQRVDGGVKVYRFDYLPPISKGHPEFDPNQPRNSDGTFAGSSGLKRAKELSAKALEATGVYMGAPSSWINGHLRTGKAVRVYFDEDGMSMTAALKRYTDMPMPDLLKALDEFTSSSEVTRAISVWRGVRFDFTEEVLKGLKPGDVITDKAYVSTTPSVEVASRFGEVFAEIELPVGARVGYTGHHVDYDANNEHEVTLPRGSRLEYTGRGQPQRAADGTREVYRFKLLPAVAKAVAPRDRARALVVQLLEMQDDSAAALKFLAALSPKVLNGSGQLKSALADVVALAREISTVEKGYPEFDPDQPRNADGTWGGAALDDSAISQGQVHSEYLRLLESYFGHANAWQLNSKLRTGQELSDVDKALVGAMDTYISEHQTLRDSFVYRGVGGKFIEVLSGLKVGDVVSSAAYTSTTTDLQFASDFAGEAEGADVIEIEVPKGTPIGPGFRHFNEDLGTSVMDEHEVVFGRGTKFRYQGVDQATRRHVLRIVPQLEKYRPDQPRDNRGRWTSAGATEPALRGVQAAARKVANGGDVKAAAAEIKQITAKVAAALPKKQGWWASIDHRTRHELVLFAVQAALIIGFVGYIYLGGPMPAVPRDPVFNAVEWFLNLFKRADVSKGYPEFNEDQPRGEDGKWSAAGLTADGFDTSVVYYRGGQLPQGGAVWITPDPDYAAVFIRNRRNLSGGTQISELWLRSKGTLDLTRFACDRDFTPEQFALTVGIDPDDDATMRVLRRLGRPGDDDEPNRFEAFQALDRAEVRGVLARQYDAVRVNQYVADEGREAEALLVFDVRNVRPVAKVVSKGYPEFDPDQPRSEDGKWSATSVTGKDAGIEGNLSDSVVNQALNMYLGSRNSAQLNGALRSGGSPDSPDLSFEYYDLDNNEKAVPLRRATEVMDAFTASHVTTKPLTVYRFVESEFMPDFGVGDTIVDKGYLSTTLDAMWTGWEQIDTMYVINVPAGVRVGPAFKYAGGNFTSEEEIVFPRGSRLVFKGRRQGPQNRRDYDYVLEFDYLPPVR